MGAYIKFFWQEDCPKCVPAKDMCNKLIERKIQVKQFDIQTIDGMTEAAFHEVLATPTTIIVDDNENELQSWRGVAPTFEDLEQNINVLFK
ncbi:hypothetical protein [[Eubacterium] cellulosolvens]